MGEWIETYRGAVLASEYDPESHMNTQLYTARFDQATWFLLSSVGITPDSMKKSNRRVAVMRQNLEFKQELKGGQLVIIKSGVMSVGDKYLRFVHRMLDGVSGDMLATDDCTAVEADLKTGKSRKLPPEVRKAAEGHVVTRRFED